MNRTERHTAAVLSHADRSAAAAVRPVDNVIYCPSEGVSSLLHVG